MQVSQNKIYILRKFFGIKNQCSITYKSNNQEFSRNITNPTQFTQPSCLQLIRSHISPGPETPSDPGGQETTKAEVRESQDGTTRNPPSKADLLRMKDLILTDSSVEAS
jgi:hypothetical protein